MFGELLYRFYNAYRSGNHDIIRDLMINEMIKRFSVEPDGGWTVKLFNDFTVTIRKPE